MESKWLSTGIPKIDEDVAQILDMPMRDTKVTTQLDENFPGTTLKSNTLEVIVVGTGWCFVTNALGLIAGGATLVAYENDIERTAAGKVDSAEISQYFDFYLAHTEILLMPEFTSKQLTRLPVVITTIADDPQYQALMDKRRRILSLGTVKYEDLPVSDKISIIEVTEMKQRITKPLEAFGVLKIINQEVTIDHVKTWAEANKPVFLIIGEQIELEAQGLAHFNGVPGFVKEFLSGSAPVESLTNYIRGRRRGLRSDT